MLCLQVAAILCRQLQCCVFVSVPNISSFYALILSLSVDLLKRQCQSKFIL